jgi:hypothetical protein
MMFTDVNEPARRVAKSKKQKQMKEMRTECSWQSLLSFESSFQSVRASYTEKQKEKKGFE